MHAPAYITNGGPILRHPMPSGMPGQNMAPFYNPYQLAQCDTPVMPQVLGFQDNTHAHPNNLPHQTSPIPVPTHNGHVTGSRKRGRSNDDDNDLPPVSPPPQKERFSYTRFQLELLNGIFDKVRYPNSVQKQLIAKRVGITRDQVKIWFQNRRRKDVVSKDLPESKKPKFESKYVGNDVLDGVIEELLRYTGENGKFKKGKNTKSNGSRKNVKGTPPSSSSTDRSTSPDSSGEYALNGTFENSTGSPASTTASSVGATEIALVPTSAELDMEGPPNVVAPPPSASASELLSAVLINRDEPAFKSFPEETSSFSTSPFQDDSAEAAIFNAVSTPEDIVKKPASPENSLAPPNKVAPPSGPIDFDVLYRRPIEPLSVYIPSTQPKLPEPMYHTLPPPPPLKPAGVGLDDLGHYLRDTPFTHAHDDRIMRFCASSPIVSQPEIPCINSAPRINGLNTAVDHCPVSTTPMMTSHPAVTGIPSGYTNSQEPLSHTYSVPAPNMVPYSQVTPYQHFPGFSNTEQFQHPLLTRPKTYTHL